MSSSDGTITTYAPPKSALTVGLSDAWGAVVSMTVCSFSTTAAVTGGGGPPNSYTAEATTSPSSTCAGSNSVHGG
jgi:hypothetical protein